MMQRLLPLLIFGFILAACSNEAVDSDGIDTNDAVPQETPIAATPVLDDINFLEFYYQPDSLRSGKVYVYEKEGANGSKMYWHLYMKTELGIEYFVTDVYFSDRVLAERTYEIIHPESIRIVDYLPIENGDTLTEVSITGENVFPVRADERVNWTLYSWNLDHTVKTTVSTFRNFSNQIDTIEFMGQLLPALLFVDENDVSKVTKSTNESEHYNWTSECYFAKGIGRVNWKTLNNMEGGYTNWNLIDIKNPDDFFAEKEEN